MPEDIANAVVTESQATDGLPEGVLESAPVQSDAVEATPGQPADTSGEAPAEESPASEESADQQLSRSERRKAAKEAAEAKRIADEATAAEAARIREEAQKLFDEREVQRRAEDRSRCRECNRQGVMRRLTRIVRVLLASS